MNTFSDIDLTILVFAHEHLSTLNGCIKSALRARDLLQVAGASVQSLLVGHTAQVNHAQWSRERLDASWDTLWLTEHRPAGPHPAAIAACRGRRIAWTDGRDLWCANWLRDAMHGSVASGGVWHPEMLITYGGEHFSDEALSYRLFTGLDGTLDSLLSHDSLPTGFLCERRLLERYPWPEADQARGWGDLNQWWHARTANAGIIHHVAPATFHYRRLTWQEMSRHPAMTRVRERMGPIELPGATNESI
jgi:hypothetical protein